MNGSWIISIIIFAIGLFFWVATYIIAPMESRKNGRYVSGFAGLPFILFVVAGLISPVKWLMLLCFFDFSFLALPFIFLRDYLKNNKK